MGGGQKNHCGKKYHTLIADQYSLFHENQCKLEVLSEIDKFIFGKIVADSYNKAGLTVSGHIHINGVNIHSITPSYMDQFCAGVSYKQCNSVIALQTIRVI